MSLQLIFHDTMIYIFLQFSIVALSYKLLFIVLFTNNFSRHLATQQCRLKMGDLKDAVPSTENTIPCNILQMGLFQFLDV